jgi:hypothetical protein
MNRRAALPRAVGRSGRTGKFAWAFRSRSYQSPSGPGWVSGREGKEPEKACELGCDCPAAEGGSGAQTSISTAW